MLSLIRNLNGQYFEEFLSACFEIGDVFSLSRNGWSNAGESVESKRILSLLSPYHINTLHTENWFCQHVPQGYEKEIYLFRATEDAKKIMLSEYKSVFYEGSVWMKPEDLCFFKNGKLFMGSLTHEDICYVYNYEVLFLERTAGLSIWEKGSDVLAEQISLHVYK